jgi:DNA-binding transcriptional LysR family regulator
MQTIISLVAANMGVALVPASLQNLQRAGVVYKPLEGEYHTLKLRSLGGQTTLRPFYANFCWLSNSI